MVFTILAHADYGCSDLEYLDYNEAREVTDSNAQTGDGVGGRTHTACHAQKTSPSSSPAAGGESPRKFWFPIHHSRQGSSATAFDGPRPGSPALFKCLERGNLRPGWVTGADEAVTVLAKSVLSFRGRSQFQTEQRRRCHSHVGHCREVAGSCESPPRPRKYYPPKEAHAGEGGRRRLEVLQCLQ